MSTNVLSGLLFILIPGVISTLYGVSRSQWRKRQDNVVFTIGMISYGVWWLASLGLFTMTTDSGFVLSELFLVMAPALALLTGFFGVAVGRMGYKLRMHRNT